MAAYSRVLLKLERFIRQEFSSALLSAEEISFVAFLQLLSKVWTGFQLTIWECWEQ